MSKTKVEREGRHAIFAGDPGGTSGIAAAHFELKPTVKETFAEGSYLKKSVEVEGGFYDQAVAIADMIARFRYTANVEYSIPLPNIHVVFEDFIQSGPSKTTNLTSCWVGGAVAALIENDLDWQTSSQAKSFANDQRLRMWGLWEVGSAHKRDAWRHVALKLNSVIG